MKNDYIPTPEDKLAKTAGLEPPTAFMLKRIAENLEKGLYEAGGMRGTGRTTHTLLKAITRCLDGKDVVFGTWSWGSANLILNKLLMLLTMIDVRDAHVSGHSVRIGTNSIHINVENRYFHSGSNVVHLFDPSMND